MHLMNSDVKSGAEAREWLTGGWWKGKRWDDEKLLQYRRPGERFTQPRKATTLRILGQPSAFRLGGDQKPHSSGLLTEPLGTFEGCHRTGKGNVPSLALSELDKEGRGALETSATSGNFCTNVPPSVLQISRRPRA